MIICGGNSEGYLGELEVCLRCYELEWWEVGLNV
jgi:hypothetical protein